MKTLNICNIYKTPSRFHYVTEYDTIKKIMIYPVVNRFAKLDAFTLKMQIVYNEDFYQ